MQYDTEGNILSSSSLGDSFTYGYDSAGLITQAVSTPKIRTIEK
jgi:YD repeat-containing protein